MRAVLPFMLMLVVCSVEAGKKKEVVVEEDPTEDVGYLIKLVAEAMFNAVASPKYKFALYMTLGFVPKHDDFVIAVSTLCNLLYVMMLVGGFLVMPRDRMLIITVLTFAVGPALVLIAIGATGAFLALAAFRPMYMALAIWIVAFLSSRIFQSVAVYLGLDQDNDGDVDWLDIVAWAATTKAGKALGLDAVHRALNARRNATITCVLERIDKLEQKIDGKLK